LGKVCGGWKTSTTSRIPMDIDITTAILRIGFSRVHPWTSPGFMDFCDKWWRPIMVTAKLSILGHLTILITKTKLSS
jgi:hypothetical protein